MSAIVPIPRTPLAIRAATMDDLPFIDALQKANCKALGFMRKAALEGKIKAGEVVIAEGSVDCGVLNVEGSQQSTVDIPQSTLNIQQSPTPVGYCIFSYRYLKRDELGVVYQMNVAPGAQRKLVAATMLKAVFENAPYGCRLFCCWCAQDLDANYFWESLGFVPIAFRTGSSRKKSPGGRARVHIFWQKRIDEMSDEATERRSDEGNSNARSAHGSQQSTLHTQRSTPYWYPSKTDGGMMREDRIVLPIPPGVHWRSEMPALLPAADAAEAQKALPARAEKEGTTLKPIVMPRRKALFGSPDATTVPVVAEPQTQKPAPQKSQPPKPKREKTKADPVLIAKARELRDRWLEQINSGQLIAPAHAKYQLTRAAASADRLPGLAESPLPALPAPVAA